MDYISREEIEKQIKKLKKGKASGEYNIKTRHGYICKGRQKKETYELIRNVWKGEKMPEDWTTSLISPLYKKRERDVTGSYRGISLPSMAYKIYAMMLKDGIKTEVEEKMILPDTQAGFRKGRRTIFIYYSM